MRTSCVVGLAGLALACGGGGAGALLPVESVLRNGSGAEVGTVRLRDLSDRMQLYVRINGLPAGEHGMHLHAAGRCDGPDFQSAGGHLNPTLRQHGHQNPQGPHLGDLGNIIVGADGRGEKTVDVLGGEARSGIRSFLALGQTGLALVVHAGRDDEKTDPSGNSGARIACAVIGP